MAEANKDDIESGNPLQYELSELKIKRSSVKGQITRFYNYLDKLCQLDSLSSIQVNELSLKLDKFLLLSPKVDEIQTRIEVLSKDNLDEELAKRESVEESLHLCIATAQDMLAAQRPKQHKRSSSPSSSSSSKTKTTCCNNHHQNDISFQLPVIKINKFDGAFFKWLEFRDTYKSLIHENDRIKPIHKYHYLCSYLEGEAARVISNLEVSEANYSEAWNLLCERYNNKRQLITNHLNSLFSIEPMSRESDKSLRFLSDHVTKNLRALKTLGQPTDQWDTIIVHMVSSKLDTVTCTKWEEYKNSLKDLPSFDDLKNFLKQRADVLETLYRSKKDKQVKTSSMNDNHLNFQTKQKQIDTYTKTYMISANNDNNAQLRPCVICQGKHRIFDCNIFKALSTDEKWAQVSKLKLCHNCLRPDHDARRCRLGGCRVCKRRHNSVLHKHDTNTNTSHDHVGSSEERPEQAGPSSSVLTAVSTTEVLLSTARIDVVNPQNNKVETVRALLDSGSQSSFISTRLKSRLQLTSLPHSATSILGIGDTSLNIIPERCRATLKSKCEAYIHEQDFLVLPRITERLPKRLINIAHLNLKSLNLALADPTFNQPSEIDVLLGADVFWDLIGTQQHPLGNELPALRSSKLGWLIAGPIGKANNTRTTESISCNFITQENSLQSQLTKFWECEEFPSPIEPKQFNTESEVHFVKNTYRSEDGRFCVRLPLIDTPDCLGDSYFLARKRFLSLEKRLNQKPELRRMYSDFIKEYRELGHLSDSKVQRTDTSYFLPHHAVLKESSESTKLRVVFDASARTSSGFSINDIQMVGPNIQDSLFNILLRFRHYEYALSGDIEKQYRQINLNELDRDLQQIVWRDNDSLPLRSLTLHTVTYGFASASFLAARCLWQLGEETSDHLIKTIIQNDFYCDDLLCGADTESDLLFIKQSVSQALAGGCFNLRKYRSNSQVIINSEANKLENDNLALSQTCHTLGMGWNPTQDALHFNIDTDTTKDITKRAILSKTFKIFDPLGLLTLCTVKPKILLQKLWAIKLDWDDPVPPVIQRAWFNFIDNIKYIKLLTIPRNILCKSPAYLELHSFSDASQAAYGACIYIKSVCQTTKHTSINLLCAKSRVAPTKATTIPRLELCGALLAARLSSAVCAALRKPIARCVYWTDSSVVLAWLNTCPSKLKTYVANRVAAIQELTNSSSWRHVPTAHNPADLASRGVDPQHVQSATVWWHGPSFLLEPEEKWPLLSKDKQNFDLPETKMNSSLFLNVEPSSPIIDFDKYSSLVKLRRIMAYVLRFINIKCKKLNFKGPLTTEELDHAMTVLTKLAQLQSFFKEINNLNHHMQLSPKAIITSLSPFLDSQGLLRVGGRLDKSDMDYDQKHPILLQSKHNFTKLLFIHEHKRLLHAGPQLMLASVREQYWPVGGRDLARRTARSCVTCRRFNAKPLTNLMGNLPSQRLVPDFPFCAVAVDFAGPFLITDRRGRGCKITKCYLCLFICLRYKCVHLEAVSELSKESYILALRRFIARRGKPKEIFCDNGRNFVAAAKEINDFLNQHSDSIVGFAADHDIKFIFSPAYAPNFNGYVEAGIKSAKFHIKRILGNTHLTYEELATLFSQVEAILNSRPISPLSSSPNDYAALTPGHFIIGRPLTSLPAPSLLDINTKRLDRYQLLEQVRQHFWNRWQREYVTELQHKLKWKSRNRDLRLGDLVILKEDNIHPLHWRLGRVCKLYPGTDGVPRVADINTAKGVVRRALNRICLLIEESSS